MQQRNEQNFETSTKVKWKNSYSKIYWILQKARFLVVGLVFLFPSLLCLSFVLKRKELHVVNTVIDIEFIITIYLGGSLFLSLCHTRYYFIAVLVMNSVPFEMNRHCKITIKTELITLVTISPLSHC